MNNSNQLWEDIQKLDDLYAILWHPDDELQFTHDGKRVIIFNKTLEEKTMTEKAERINGWAAMIGVIAAIGSYATTGQIIPGIW